MTAFLLPDLVRALVDALPRCGSCTRPSLIVDDRDYYHESYHCLEHVEYLRDDEGALQLGLIGECSYYAAPWAGSVMRAVDLGLVPWK